MGSLWVRTVVIASNAVHESTRTGRFEPRLVPVAGRLVEGFVEFFGDCLPVFELPVSLSVADADRDDSLFSG